MTTLRDVAEAAGVSAMTVSNVVNGRAGKVSAATAARVREAIETLGYVPSAPARALAGATSRIVALLYGASDGAPALASSHDAAFVAACEQACRAEGLSLMLCAIGAQEPAELLDRLRAWSVAGVLAMGTVPEVVLEAVEGVGIGLVTIDVYPAAGTGAAHSGTEAVPSHSAGVPVRRSGVNIDDAGGAALVGARLVSLGHHRLAFLGPLALGSPVVAARLAGFRSGAAAGLADGDTAQVESLDVEVSFAAGADAGEALGSRPAGEKPTAVLASGDVLALGVVAGLRRAGLRVPGDVSVVGFDGFEVSTYLDQPLTAIRQSVEDKAREAVRLLVALGDHGSRASEGPRSTDRVVLPVAWREGGTLAGPFSN